MTVVSVVLRDTPF